MPHQGAQKLTKTGLEDSKTSDLKVSWLTASVITPLQSDGLNVIGLNIKGLNAYFGITLSAYAARCTD